MKISRPSPALIVSIVAVVIACAGTATAAGLLIKNSSQVATGAINNGDIKDGTILTKDLSTGLKNQIGGTGSFTAVEASRRSGPNNSPSGNHTVATMTQLAPGTYALFAKTTISPVTGDAGILLELLARQNRTVGAECALKAGGDEDRARDTIASPYSVSPATINMQMTRTIAEPTDITVSCTVENYSWNAADTSIVALKLSGSSRSDVQQ
jgi:hypothetical protein